MHLSINFWEIQRFAGMRFGAWRCATLTSWLIRAAVNKSLLTIGKKKRERQRQRERERERKRERERQ
jgi:hypothetical protein